MAQKHAERQDSFRPAQLNIIEALSEKLAPAYRKAYGELSRCREAKSRDTLFQDMKAQLNNFIGDELSLGHLPVFGAKTKLEDIAEKNEYWLFQAVVGGSNFKRARQPFAATFAYIKNGKPLVAAVYFPMEDILTSAVAGEGVQVGVKGRASDITELASSDVLYNYCSSKGMDAALLEKLHNAGAKIRISGCQAADIVAVAAGRAEALIAEAVSLPLSATAWLYLKEAQVKLTQKDGSPFTLGSASLAAANTKLHTDLQGVL